MKLINKLITKTVIYKHLNDLYEQALRDGENYLNDSHKILCQYNKLQDKYFSMQTEYNKMQNDLFQLQKFNINPEKYIEENQRLYSELEYNKKYSKEFDFLCYEIDDLINDNDSFDFENIDLQNAKKVLIEISKLVKDKKIGNIQKKMKKIRTHVNKLDKKDENVKEIKRLIKEVL